MAQIIHTRKALGAEFQSAINVSARPTFFYKSNKSVVSGGFLWYNMLKEILHILGDMG